VKGKKEEEEKSNSWKDLEMQSQRKREERQRESKGERTRKMVNSRNQTCKLWFQMLQGQANRVKNSKSAHQMK
jgi:hypothetical protein